MNDNETPLSPEEVEDLIRNSSFGDPNARALIARVPKPMVDKILKKLKDQE